MYRARVRDSPAGTTPSVPLRLPFLSEETAEDLIQRLEDAIIDGRGNRAGPLSSQEKILRDFGSRVFCAVFRDNEQIASRFRSSMDIARSKERVAGLRLKLGVEPPELALLPWEYLFDESVFDPGTPQSYLCLRDLSPLVRFLEVNGPVKSSRIVGPLRILGMISNPNIPGRKHLDIGAERLELEEAVRKLEPKVHFEWLTSGTREHLCNAMQDGRWHVFHFIGHGGTDTEMEDGNVRSRGYIFMEDRHCNPEKVDAEDLAYALEGNGDLRLAVLNCCDSGRGSSFASPGAHLVRWGVPLVVAMQFAISNGSASVFAKRFYRALISGHSVERAITSARRDVRFESRVEWGIPVLLTRTETSTSFEIDSTGEDSSAPLVKKTARNAQARAELRQLLGVDDPA
ncbi:CHAT domain-containing protein [Paraburkholderia piptadeniae]|uniref:CHAT domain-containing protein n=1 Tax=Paraburkholderia piptadeniae TaxID=1701573 RepID=UPI001C46A724|nr:CHAT domain-containing protein [Paraburkholderia piptadeniae]